MQLLKLLCIGNKETTQVSAYNKNPCINLRLDKNEILADTSFTQG